MKKKQAGEVKVKSVKKTCLVCKRGEVAEKLVNEFVDSGLPIDGPGSEQQYKWVSRGFYCQYCGVKYEHCDKLPPVMAYCSWGDHYVDPEDIIDQGQGEICKRCDESLKRSVESLYNKTREKNKNINFLKKPRK